MGLNNWLSLLVDPETKAPLTYAESRLVNPEGKTYGFIGQKPDFVGIEQRQVFEEQQDFLDRLKTSLKAIFGRYYEFLIYVFAPVYVRIHWPSLSIFLKHKVAEICPAGGLAIQLGSGNSRLSEKVLNIDIFNYEEVDLIADCAKLPFADGSVDCVISNAVLEHVTEPESFLAEAFRVLKPGGRIVTGAPFIQGFHASPSDYFRWTRSGLIHMHCKSGFEMAEMIPISGPTSGFLWIAQEWLAILLSFNIDVLYRFWWFVLTLVLIPVKFLDVLLLHFKNADKINSFYLYVGQKSAVSRSVPQRG